VNTPAAAQLVALTSRATSSAPFAFKPACAAAAVKPPGDVTEPSGIGVYAAEAAGGDARGGGGGEGISAENSATGSLV
jgi:hypothetical protein